MTDTFFIVGAGGFAREIYSYLAESNFSIGNCVLSGFLDDNPNALDGCDLQHQVLNPLFTSNLPSGAKLVLAIANSNVKEKIYNFYNELGVEFLTYKHSTAFIGQRVTIGDGTIVAPQCVITSDVRVGKCVTINALSSIGHDAQVGDFSTLSSHCDVTGFAQLGRKVFMGSHALVIPKVKVGEGAVIGAGSVVISKVKSGTTVFGNPAKKIK